METIKKAANVKKRIFDVRAFNETSVFTVIFQTRKRDALASSSIDIALQKWEPDYAWFSGENSIPQELSSTLWIENAPLREWETKGCLVVCLVHKLILCRTILQWRLRKVVAYTKRWLAIIESGDNFSQYSQLSRKQTTLGIGKSVRW